MIEQEFKVWDGEECHNCGKSLEGRREVTRYDGNYFCCEECFGAYLAEKFYYDAVIVDFISREDERMMIEEWKGEHRETY